MIAEVALLDQDQLQHSEVIQAWVQIQPGEIMIP